MATGTYRVRPRETAAHTLDTHRSPGSRHLRRERGERCRNIDQLPELAVRLLLLTPRKLERLLHPELSRERPGTRLAEASPLHRGADPPSKMYQTKSLRRHPYPLFTHADWKLVNEGKISVSAAPFPPSELGRNARYVFALPPRFDYDFSTGYQEVESLIRQKSLHAPCGTGAIAR